MHYCFIKILRKNESLLKSRIHSRFTLHTKYNLCKPKVHYGEKNEKRKENNQKCCKPMKSENSHFFWMFLNNVFVNGMEKRTNKWELVEGRKWNAVHVIRWKTVQETCAYLKLFLCERSKNKTQNNNRAKRTSSPLTLLLQTTQNNCLVEEQVATFSISLILLSVSVRARVYVS